MGIGQVYTIGGNVCTIGGIPVGSGIVTPPSAVDKTLWLATNHANATLSASAYLNGTGDPVAVWSASGVDSSASASVHIGSGDTIVVWSEANRPENYSSRINSTGFTTSNLTYTDYATVKICGQLGFDGADSAIMRSQYYGAHMIVTGEGRFWVGLYNKKLYWPESYASPMAIPNSASSSPVAHLAFTKESWHAGSYVDWSAWSAYQYVPTVSAFTTLRITASGTFSMTKAATAGSSVISALQKNPDPYVLEHCIQSATFTSNLSNYNFGFTGSVNTKASGTASSYYTRPAMQINTYKASAFINQSYWKYSGILK
jgi:hypothetical protein